MENTLPAGLTVNGNESLVYSIFRNLTDNVINHAGEGVHSHHRKRAERNGYVYISFADDGCGIGDRSKLNRALRTFLPSRRGTHEGRGRFRARTVDSEEHRQPPRRNHNSQRAP